MKPIKLIMRAFGPYTYETEVDFTKFDGGGIFLITGDTGAGKTTIFDGIVYALYGTASGNWRTTAMLRNANAPGDIETVVNFTFESKGKLYNIVRKPEQQRPKKRGTGMTTVPSSVELSFDDDREPLIKSDDVSRTIKSIIGLDGDQFRQIVMIAQGDFLKVLNSSTEERRAIFRKVFRTEKYELLQKRLNEQVVEMATQLKQMHERMGGSLALSMGDFRQDEERNSQGFEDLCNEIKTAVKKGKEHLKECKIQIKENDLLNQKLVRRQAELNQELYRINSYNKLLEKHERLLAENKSNKLSMEDAPKLKQEIKAMNDQYSKLDGSIAQYEEISHIIGEVKDLEISEKKTTETIVKRDIELKALENKIARTSDKIKAFESGDLDTAILVVQMNKLESKVLELIRLREGIEHLDEISGEYSAAADRYTRISKEYDKARERLEMRRGQYLDQQAGVLASQLEEGSPCPVCGSLDHPQPAKRNDNDVTKKDIDIDEKEVNSLDALRISGADEANRLKGQMTSQKTLVDELVVNVGFEELFSHKKVLVADVEAGINALQAEYDKLQEEKNNREKNLEAYKILKTDLAEWNNDKGDLASMISKEKEKRSGIRSRSKTLLENLEYRRSQLSYSGIDELRAKLNDLAENIEKKESEVMALEAVHNRLAKDITAVESQMEMLIHQMKSRDENKVDNAITELEMEIKQLDSERAAKHNETNTLTNDLENKEHTLRLIEEMIPKIRTLEEKCDQVRMLAATCGGTVSGKDKIQLETFVQTHYLDLILERANTRLINMSGGQYELVRQTEVNNKQSQSGLDLDVFDIMNGTSRSARSLSGGESFQASLCLALGLSEIVQEEAGGISIETMFIDEGFGTLDEMALNQALDGLYDLVKGRKLVGIISHVDVLKERIDKKLIVEKDKNKGSKISIQI